MCTFVCPSIMGYGIGEAPVFMSEHGSIVLYNNAWTARLAFVAIIIYINFEHDLLRTFRLPFLLFGLL
jgi:hypothetical protein